jgi:hypothetical protein
VTGVLTVTVGSSTDPTWTDSRDRLAGTHTAAAIETPVPVR